MGRGTLSASDGLLGTLQSSTTASCRTCTRIYLAKTFYVGGRRQVGRDGGQNDFLGGQYDIGDRPLGVHSVTCRRHTH